MRSDDQEPLEEELDEEDAEDSSDGRYWPLKSLISSSKCVRRAIRRPRSVQSFLKRPPPVPPTDTTATSFTSFRSSGVQSPPSPAAATAISLAGVCGSFVVVCTFNGCWGFYLSETRKRETERRFFGQYNAISTNSHGLGW